MPSARAVLSGVQVVEIGQGAAMAYCGRLLRDAGASVQQVAFPLETATTAQERAYDRYLQAGDSVTSPDNAKALEALCAWVDIVLIGEESAPSLVGLRGGRTTVRLSWFGEGGAYSGWKGSDLIVQALTAMPHLAGPVEGPPLYAGDRHSTMVGGVTAYIAALAGMLATPQRARHFEVSIHEANLVLSEMDIHFVERDGVPLERHGINRFSPDRSASTSAAKAGSASPPSRRSMARALRGAGNEEGSRRSGPCDPRAALRAARRGRAGHHQGALSTKSAAEWGDILREHRVPGVVVPDADGILSHPIFTDGCADRSAVQWQGKAVKAARTAFGLSKTRRLRTEDAVAKAGETRPATLIAANRAGEGDRPLSGLVVADFTMGWAGPLASHLLADLGAEVLKIEAGRYPDWWRGVNWTPELIEAKQYEDAKGYCALNRGKHGVSLDLTSAKGRKLPRR